MPPYSTTKHQHAPRHQTSEHPQIDEIGKMTDQYIESRLKTMVRNNFMATNFPISYEQRKLRRLAKSTLFSTKLIISWSHLIELIIDRNWERVIDKFSTSSSTEININHQDSNGMTALMHIIKIDNEITTESSDSDHIYTIVSLMLSCNVNTEVEDKKNRSVLMFSLFNWDKWVDLLAVPLKILDYISWNGRGIISRLLYELFHDVNREMMKYLTRLIIYYIKQGANLNVPDNYGKFPLHYALHFKPIFDIIIKHGGDTSLSINYCSLLCIMSSNDNTKSFTNHVKNVQYIVRRGANIHVRCNKCGKLPKLTEELLEYHRIRRNIVDAFLDSTPMCVTVSKLVLEMAGECSLIECGRSRDI